MLLVLKGRLKVLNAPYLVYSYNKQSCIAGSKGGYYSKAASIRERRLIEWIRYSYTSTWMQFVFPFYIWFLILVIVLASRYSSRISRMTTSNAVLVLATLLLLSYSTLPLQQSLSPTPFSSTTHQNTVSGFCTELSCTCVRSTSHELAHHPGLHPAIHPAHPAWTNTAD